MFPLETISAKMLDYYVDRSDALIIDLRSSEAYDRGHVRGALSVPYDELENRADLPRGKLLILYCERGGSSLMAAKQLTKRGYRTRSVIGGFRAYRGRNTEV